MAVPHCLCVGKYEEGVIPDPQHQSLSVECTLLCTKYHALLLSAGSVERYVWKGLGITSGHNVQKQRKYEI